MRMDAERIGGVTTADDDPRITRVGWWLRKTKVDELPQLVNVLVGEMSLVGPRPEVERYVRLMTDEERVILSVAPGLTDWATLWNSDEGALLAGVADPDEMYLRVIRPEKIRLQLEYVRRRSFWIDITILLRTAAAIVLRIKPQALSLREHPR
jgi:lipopolysaccharide/colanic/teichoic acid biosynthesis glycosyltransferase